jgi:hypothetical protein
MVATSEADGFGTPGNSTLGLAEGLAEGLADGLVGGPGVAVVGSALVADPVPGSDDEQPLNASIRPTSTSSSVVRTV